MVLLTFGLWLLVIPLYPARCINCGVRRGEAIFALTPDWARFIGIAALIATLLAAVVIGLHSDRPEPALVTKGPDYDEIRSTSTVRGQVVSSTADGPLTIDATSLLSQYGSNEDAAETRYKNNIVNVTGALTGVFIPSAAVIMRLAEKGESAHAFVTMGGPRPSSPEETLLLPGIRASSDESSVFGFQDLDSAAQVLSVGNTVTLNCTCGAAFRMNETEYGQNEPAYSLSLYNCKLRRTHPDDSRNGGDAEMNATNLGITPPKSPTTEPSQVSRDGSVSIDSQPVGTHIFIDSIPYGPAPAIITLRPGKHSVELAMSGYKDWSTEIEVASGATVNVSAGLEEQKQKQNKLARFLRHMKF